MMKHLLLLLPDEGLCSKRAFALFCAERVSHLITDTKVVGCLAVVRRRVDNPKSVSDMELSLAANAAWSVCTEAADVFGWAAASVPITYAAIHAADFALSITPRFAHTAEQHIQLKHLLFLTNVSWTFAGLVQISSMSRVI
jgi:hypothetical protein